MDIIKLYGSGIEEFVPDLKMKHDFYRIANVVIKNPNIKLRLTIEGDDICKPCVQYYHICKDQINHIPTITSKDEYNQLLDQRIIKLFQLRKDTYTALELCQIYYVYHHLIFQVWKEEEHQVTQKRHDLFVKGAKKYIQQHSKGFGYCGLACDYCTDLPDCLGCKQGGCPHKEDCKNYQCCTTKGYHYCYECDQFPCDDSILHKLRIRTFCQFIQLYGEETLRNCLIRNKEKGIQYHHSQGHIGDYDQFDNEDDIIELIKNGYHFKNDIEKS